MNSTCYPVSVLPHLSRLYQAYLRVGEFASGDRADESDWYAVQPGDGPTEPTWASRPVLNGNAPALADAVEQSTVSRHFGPETRGNVQKLREGARAVVTGQQAGLFGGPLLTLLKAATAIARARQAEQNTGVPHVPVFWVATEDHDLDEVNQATFAGKSALEVVRLEDLHAHGGEVGSIPLGPEVASALDQATILLNYAPVTVLLEETYGAPEATFGSAFAAWIARLFAPHGLIVVDASTRAFHALGASTLRFAIEHAADLEEALLARSASLVGRGFHAQVLVKPGSSLLFLVTDDVRSPLRRLPDGAWKAASSTYSTADLLAILESEPERLSPNALLRPVFQDTIFPVAAYVGGPAEIAYFAQSEVLYRRILHDLTPVLPRFSATLVEPAVAALLQRFELDLPGLIASGTADSLAQRLGARSMPIEGKRYLASAGNALDTELTTLTGYMSALDADLGRSAHVAASKMRYQMNRLRRLAASFELQKQTSLRRHAETILLYLYPSGHAQERVLAGVQLLAAAGEAYPELISALVKAAEDPCPGHTVITL